MKLVDKASSHICRCIKTGDFKVGDILPSVDVLAEKVGCSRETLRRALRNLARSGVVRSVTSVGSVVLREPARGRVCILLSTEEHTNLLFQSRICEALISAGYDVSLLPQLADAHATTVWSKRLRSESSEPQALVVLQPPEQNTPRGDAFLELAKGFERRVYFTIEHEVPMWLPNGARVLVDFHHGARSIAEHLLKLGHRHMGCAMGWTPHPHTTASRIADWFSEMISLAGATCYKHHESAGNDGLLNEIRSQNLTAFVDMNDHRAVQRANWLAQRGVGVPKDLSLVGRNNSPWAMDFAAPLTSLSLNPSGVAQAIVETLNQAESHDCPLKLVKPEVIVRESTRAV